MSLGMEQRYNLKDGQKNITFMGWLLGGSSSETPDSVRWTELALYKTISGAYILSKVGRSDVFHSDDCNQLDRNNKPKSKGKRYIMIEDAMPEEAAGDYAEDWFVPCEHCKPEYEDSPVWVERDIYSAPVYDSVHGAVGALYQKRGGNRYLSRPARELLEQAAQRDPALRSVLEQPVEID